MNPLKLAITAALIAGSSVAMAEQMSTDTTRDQRMDAALQDYRSKQMSNDRPGPAARAENSMKRGAHKAGAAMKHGAEATGHAIKKGAHKAGEAMDHAGDKMEHPATDKP